MRIRIGFVFILFVFCIFTLTACKSESNVTEGEEIQSTPSETGEEEVKTPELEMMAKMTFSEEAEDYLMSKDWETNPKDSFVEQIIEVKTKLEENYKEADRMLAQMGAQIEDDSMMMNLISDADISEFFGKYPDRKLSFEIRHVFVDKILEKKYIGEENEENEIDMVAYIIFKYRLIETEEGKNYTGFGSLKCYHRKICNWICEF